MIANEEVQLQKGADKLLICCKLNEIPTPAWGTRFFFPHSTH
jgi:hypothetical protein